MDLWAALLLAVDLHMEVEVNMATLPLYQPTGLLPADIPRLDRADVKESQAQLTTITSALDRVSDFAFKKANEQAEREGLQYGAENQPSADQVLAAISRKKHWVNEAASSSEELSIISKRIDPAPGTHTIKYSSTVDDIEITHTAHNRIGFAGGAVLAAEFLHGKQGIYSMKDVLGL
jgi:dihydrodipicolinate reductase